VLATNGASNSDIDFRSWQDHADRWRADADAQQYVTQRRIDRAKTRPELRRWIERLNDGAEPLRDLQVEFDRRTRSEWDCFGLGGPSGAMVLNKWVKHHPEHGKVHALLREVLPLPVSPEQAALKLRNLHAFLVDSIERLSLTPRQLEPKRAVRLMTCLWGVQADDEFSSMYSSAIKMLLREGLIPEFSDKRARLSPVRAPDEGRR
jgi:hypothetical protein